MLNKTKHVMVFHVIVIESLLHDSWDYIKTSIHLKGETDVNRHSIQNMLFVCLMVFNATYNTISVISWRSVLLVEETGGPGENHQTCRK